MEQKWSRRKIEAHPFHQDRVEALQLTAIQERPYAWRRWVSRQLPGDGHGLLAPKVCVPNAAQSLTNAAAVDPEQMLPLWIPPAALEIRLYTPWPLNTKHVDFCEAGCNNFRLQYEGVQGSRATLARVCPRRE